MLTPLYQSLAPISLPRVSVAAGPDLPNIPTSGLLHWFDTTIASSLVADSAGRIATGGEGITQWRDRRYLGDPSAAFASDTGTQTGTAIITDARSGLPILQATGNAFHRFADYSLPLNMFVVLAGYATDGNRELRMLGAAQPSSQGWSIAASNSSGHQYSIVYEGHRWQYYTVGPPSSLDLQVFEFRVNGGATTKLISAAGAVIAENDGANTPIDKIELYRHTSYGDECRFGEVLVYDHLMETADASAVRAYLAAKWSVPLS